MILILEYNVCLFSKIKTTYVSEFVRILPNIIPAIIFSISSICIDYTVRMKGLVIVY